MKCEMENSDLTLEEQIFISSCRSPNFDCYGSELRLRGTFIYVISPKSGVACKIGLAKYPRKRLGDLQVGCWEKLEFAGCIGFVEDNLMPVEKLAHKLAEKVGRRLSGEWFDITPTKALECIYRASLEFGIEPMSVTDYRILADECSDAEQQREKEELNLREKEYRKRLMHKLSMV
jgi:hypothetical protein